MNDNNSDVQIEGDVSVSSGVAHAEDPMTTFTREMLMHTGGGGGEEDPPVANQRQEATAKKKKDRAILKETIKIGASWDKAKAKRSKEQLAHVQETAAKIGDAVGKKTAQGIEVSENSKVDMLRQMHSFREAPFYCTPVVNRLTIDSPTRIIQNELKSYKDELMTRRAAKSLEAIPGAVFAALSKASIVAENTPKLRHITSDIINLKGIDEEWKRELADPQNGDLKLLLQELYVSYGSYFKIRPEYVLISSILRVAMRCNAKNMAAKAMGGGSGNAPAPASQFDVPMQSYMVSTDDDI